MYKLKYYSYEITSIAFGLALLAFFGTMSFLPFEIMILGEGQMWFWVFIILSLSGIIAFLLLSFYKCNYSFIIIRIFDVLTTVCAIFAAITFLIFTKDLLEPWLIQAAWYFRYHGLIIGLLLGCVMIKTIAGLSFFISKIKDIEKQKDFQEKNLRILAFLFVVITFTFYIIEILLYRYLTLFSVFLSIFLFQICLLIISLFLISNSKYSLLLKLEILDKIDINQEEKIKSFNIGKKKRNSRITKLNLKLRCSGTDPKDFWWTFIPLLIVGILAVITLILYPFNLFIHISFPWENYIMEVDIPIVQILSYIIIGSIFIILTVKVFRSRNFHRFGKIYQNKRRKNLKISLLGFIDGLKFIGLFLIIILILYFFNYPIYFPRVISFYLLFGIIGALIYLTLGKSQKIRNILYIIAILLLILNFYLIYVDIVNNAKNYLDSSFDIIFPFKYLFSFYNYIIVGISIGIIICDFFLNFVFKHTDGTDSTSRAFFLAYICFIGGMLMMLVSSFIPIPGGDKPTNEIKYDSFYLFCVVLIVILIFSLFVHIITEIILPWLHKKRIKTKIEENRKKIDKKIKINRNKNEIFQKRAIAISISIIIILATIGVFGIFYTFRENYQKPIIAYSTGNYYIWVANSSERVSKNTIISVASSPKIDAVKFNMAKNEYYAFQLVWRPLGEPIKDLAYEISDFKHQKYSSEIIYSNCCSLRYEEFIIEGEFPDILKPFSKLDLNKKQNYIFWFSIRAPYNALAGKYHGDLEFNFNNDESEIINIQINIWDFAIPKMRHVRTNIGGFSGDYERVQDYLDHRLNDYGERILQAKSIEQLQSEEKYTCYLNESSNEWIFDWAYFDNQTQFKLDNGMNAFQFRDPFWWREPDLKDEKKLLWHKKWLQEVQAHMEAKNWLNYCYYYFIDEFQLNIPEGYTREKYYDLLEEFLKIIKEAAPKIKISTTSPPSEELKALRKYFDIYCPISSDRDKEGWTKQINDGKEFWMYACIGPAAPWPNAHLYNRLYECRILMWQTWLYNLHGFLYWRSHAYYHGKYGLANNGYGNGWFIYEQEGNVYDSLRWENFLDGQEDYEYLWLLNASLWDLHDKPELISGKKLRSLRAEFDEIVNSIVGEKWEYCNHPSTLYNGRESIGTLLNELSSLINITSIGEAQWYAPYNL
ncbi:MAG: glycoside hydrolase domain-containing protein [Promethearchaeota archaeon]